MDYPRGGNFPRGYWICVDVDGNTGGGWGWDRERVDRLFSFFFEEERLFLWRGELRIGILRRGIGKCRR